MTISRSATPDRLNTCLAWLLSVGSWLSCVLIATGMVSPMLSGSARSSADHLVSIGIVLLIALPVTRVAAMCLWFVLHRDLDFALVAALVLAIIIASTLLGAGAA
jgi:uncharacterized membrane protein